MTRANARLLVLLPVLVTLLVGAGVVVAVRASALSLLPLPGREVTIDTGTV
jgi:hypothetical protein